MLDFFRRKFWRFKNIMKTCPVDESNVGFNHPYSLTARYSGEEMRKMTEVTLAEACVPSEPVIFHSYWCGEFGRKQALSVRSVLATQKNCPFEVWLWFDEALCDETAKKSIYENEYIREFGDKVSVHFYSPDMVKASPMKKVAFLFNEREQLSYRADGFRMWVLNKFGGIWFDLDILFLRDLGGLISKGEFVYAWEKQNFANNAVIYLKKGSSVNEYLASKVVKKHSTQPWCLFAYSDKKLADITVYPSDLFDPLWLGDQEFYGIHNWDEFFTASPVGNSATLFPGAVAYHWHNRWKSEVEENSYFDRIEKEYALVK